jgi:hypothetical protein
MIKKITAAVLAAGLCFSCALPASAQKMTDTYNYDRWGEAIPSQAGYEAVKSISGTDLGSTKFSGISDIFIGTDGRFYIADSGNHRVIIADGELSRVISEISEVEYKGKKTALGDPRGVFADSSGMICIADTENSMIVRCDEKGKADLLITKPESEQYTAVTFKPVRVLCDKAGFIYAVDENINTGAVMFEPDGTFRGYYGANRVEQTGRVLRDHFWKYFATEEMRKYMTNAVPAAIAGFDIDDGGFIYTCSSSLSQDTDKIKKVNAAGYDLFAGLEVEFGDRPTADYSDFPKNSYVDIDVSPDGMINCLDYTNGRVFQYDEECNLLFIFGNKGNKLGTFRQVSAVESSEDRVFVADSQKNTITVFEKTKFGETVHRAALLYNAGYYSEALEPWFEVLGRDGNYRRAYIGIASAYINEGRYGEAMKYAKLADSRKLYDRAFEGWREKWISSHLSSIAAAVTALIIAAAVFKAVKRKRCSKK